MAMRLKKITSYTRNLARSFGYGALDSIGEYTPVTKSIIDATKMTYTEAKSSIKEMMSESGAGGKVKSFTYDVMQNTMEDLKSGKWYNKEREDGMFGDFDFGDDFGDEDWGDADWGDDDATESEAEMANDDKNTREIIGSMGKVSGNISKSFGHASAKSAEYIVKNQRASTTALMNINARGFNQISSILLNMDNTVTSLASMAQPMNTFMHNSFLFYTNTTESLNKINDNLAILVQRTAMLDPKAKKDKSVKGSFGSIFSGGQFDASAYADMVKDNLKEYAELAKGIGSMVSMMSGGLGGGKPTMSLTKMAITLMTKAMIPGMTKESMKQFDKALSNAIGRGFIQMRKSNSFLGSLLADLFAPKTDYSTKIGTKYERGPLPWDGEAKQALVEVIPTYLAKLNAILGGEEKYYDYEEGKFKTVRQIQAEKEKLINDAAQRAGGEFRDELIKDAKGNKELERQIDTYFREAFDDGREYDLLAFIADPKTLAKKYGITENAAKHIINNYKRYKAKSSTTGAMNKKNELYPKYVINREIERSDLTNKFRNMGGEHSIFVKLEDGSITAIDDGKDKKGKKNNNQGGSAAERIAARYNGHISTAIALVIPEYLEAIYGALNAGYSFHYNYETGKFENNTKKQRNAARNAFGPEKGGTASSGSAASTAGGKATQNDDGTVSLEFNNMEWTLTTDQFRQYQKLDNDKERREFLYTTKAQNGYNEFNEKLGKNKLIKGFKDLFNFPGMIASKGLNAATNWLNGLFWGGDNANKPGMFKKIGSFFKDRFSDVFDKDASDFRKAARRSGLPRGTADVLIDNIDDITVYTAIDKYGNPIGTIDKVVAEAFFEKYKDLHDKVVAKRINGLDPHTVDIVIEKVDGQNVYQAIDAEGKRLGSVPEEVAKKFFSKRGLWSAIKHEFKAFGAKAKDYFFGGSIGEYMDAMNNNGTAARGRKVTKSGIAIVSEGEMIIPSEYNPYYHGKTNKAAQIANERRIARRNGFYGAFAEGGTVGDAAETEEATKEETKAGAKIGIFTKFMGNMFSKGTQAFKEFFNSAMAGTEEDKNRIFDRLKKTMEDIGENKGALGIGAITGAGVSLLTGAVIGPLAGAAIGGAVGLLTKSKAFQEFVFGKGDPDSDGYDPGMLGEFGRILKQNSDGMKGAGIGGIIGLTGGMFMGSPILGTIVGSTIGFAARSSKFQDWAFGEKDENGVRQNGKLLDTETQQKLKKRFPSIVAGAALGGLIGPFATPANIIVGSALGYAAGSEKFHKWLYGDPDDPTNKYGLMGKINDIVHNMGNAINGFLRRMGGRISDFLKKMGQSIFNPIVKKAKDFTENYKERKGFLGTVAKGLDFVTNGLGRGIYGIADFAKNGLQKHNLKKGNAVYSRELGRNMTAFERAMARKDRGIDGGIYDTVDNFLSYIDDEEFVSLNSIKGDRNFNKLLAQQMEEKGFGNSADLLKNLKGPEMAQIRAYIQEEARDVSKRLKEKEEARKRDPNAANVEKIKDTTAEIKDTLKQILDRLANPDSLAGGMIAGEDSLNDTPDEKEQKKQSRKEKKRDRRRKKEEQHLRTPFTSGKIGDLSRADRKKEKREAKIEAQEEEALNQMAEEAFGPGASSGLQISGGTSGFFNFLFGSTDEDGNRTEGLIDKIRKVRKSGSKDNKKKRRTVYTDYGPVQITTNNQGEEVEDRTDTETTKTLKARSKFQEAVNAIPSIGDKLSQGFGWLKDKLFGGEDEEGKENKSFFDKIADFLNLDDESSWIGGLLSRVKTFFTSFAVGNFLPALVGGFVSAGAFSGMFDKLVEKITDKLPWNKNKPEGTHAYGDNSQTIYDEEGNAVATYGSDSTFSNRITRNLAVGLATGKGFGTVGGWFAKLGGNAVGKLFGFKGGKTNVGTTIGKVLSKASYDEKMLAISAHLASGFDDVFIATLRKVEKVFPKLAGTADKICAGAVQSAGSAAGSITPGKAWAQKVMSKFGPRLASAKGIVNKLGKAAAVIQIIYCVARAIEGYETAENIFGITRECTVGERALGAVIGALNGFIGDFFDDKELFDMGMQIGEWAGIDKSTLAEERKAAVEEVEAYNAEHGTSYDVEGYNRMTGLSTGGVVRTWGENFKTYKTNIKQKGFWQATKDVFTKFGNDVSEAYKEGSDEGGFISGLTGANRKIWEKLLPGSAGEVNTQIGDITGYAFTSGMPLKERLKNIWSATLSKFTLDKTVNNTKTNNPFEKVWGGIFWFLAQTTTFPVKVWATMLSFINVGVEGITGFFKKTMDNFKNIGDTYKENATKMGEHMLAGDLQGLWKSDYNELDGLGGSILKVITHFQKLTLTIPTVFYKFSNWTRDTFVKPIEAVKTDTSNLSTSVAALKKMSDKASSFSDIEDILADESFKGTSSVGGFMNAGYGLYKTFSAISGSMNILGNKVKDGIDKVKGFFSGIFSKDLDNIDDDTTSDGKHWWDKAASWVKGVWDSWSKKSGGRSGIAGGDSGFVSQFDPKYQGYTIGGQSFGARGCGPAVASMAANALGRPMSVSQAVRASNGYQTPDGVTLDYFANALGSRGIDTQIIAGGSSQDMYNRIASGEKMVLLGRDPYNTSKDNSPFGPNNHYVLATGVDRRGNIIVNDPENNGPRAYDPNILRSASYGVAGGRSSLRNSGRRHMARLRAKFNKFRVAGGNTYDTANAQYIWAYFSSQGFSDAAVAGIMGNLYAESHLDPTAIQGGGKGPAAGIAQWENYNTKSARWANLNKYAQSKGTDWTDLQTQLEWINAEMNDPGSCSWGAQSGMHAAGVIPTSLDAFRASTNVEQATREFEGAFERAGVPHFETRIAAAKAYYELYSGKDLSTALANYQCGSVSSMFKSAKNDDGTTTLSSGAKVTGKIGTVLSDVSSIFSTAFSNFFNGRQDTGNTTGSTDSTGTTSATSSAASYGTTGFSGGEYANGFPYYNQKDNPWGPMIYGKHANATTYREAGCGPTSMAMVMKSYGVTPNLPNTVGDWAVAKGYRNANNGTYAGLFPGLAKATGLQANSVNANQAYEALQNNIPVIGNTGGHYVVFTGINGEGIVINDPYHIDRTNKIWDKSLLSSSSNMYAIAGPDGTGSLGKFSELTQSQTGVMAHGDVQNVVMQNGQAYYKYKDGYTEPVNTTPATSTTTTKKAAKGSKASSGTSANKNMASRNVMTAAGSGLLSYGDIANMAGGSSGLLLRSRPGSRGNDGIRHTRLRPIRFSGGASGIVEQTSTILNNVKTSVANAGQAGAISPELVAQLLASITALLEKVADNTAPVGNIYAALKAYLASGGASGTTNNNSNNAKVTPVKNPDAAMMNNDDNVDKNIQSLVGVLAQLAKG